MAGNVRGENNSSFLTALLKGLNKTHEKHLAAVTRGQYTLMMMMTGSEVPRATFSSDDSVMDSQNSESCYSW